MVMDPGQPSIEYQKKDHVPRSNVAMVESRNEYHHRVMTANPPRVSENDESLGLNGSRKVSDVEAHVCTEDGRNMDSFRTQEPHDGMDFESKEEAFSYYKEYAMAVGFAAIIKASRRSRISGNFIDAKFVCTRYGSKPHSATAETTGPIPKIDSAGGSYVKKKRGRINRSWSKTDCKACMHVKRRRDGRWVIYSFIKEHNHEIIPDQTYYSQCHRHFSLDSGNVDTSRAIRARTRKMYVTMSRKTAGHRNVVDQKGGISNQSTTGKYLALEERDSQFMLDYFINMQGENPNFFYAMNWNEEQQLKSIFWVDAKARLDYTSFSDVVFFDTTYVKSEYKLPLVPFFGVNHHFQLMLFGCALVADDTKSTYVWLMHAWLRAMHGCAPNVIITDQKDTLKEAVAEVFPKTRHCFSLWHILSKVPERLSSVIKKHDNFMVKFSKCLYESSTTEQFEKRWWKLVDKYDLSHDRWFQSLYEDHDHWVPLYMRGIFLAGMCTAQRSESIISSFDKNVQRRTSLKEFLEQYKIVLQERLEEEAKADFETRHKQPALKSPSPFGKQLAKDYTHAIFKKFQVEVLGVVACHPKKEREDGAIKKFRVQDFEKNRDFLVTWNDTTSDMSCLCHSFEYNGFLCRHVLIVLQMSGVHNIPSQHVLRRWTKDAKRKQIKCQDAGIPVLESRYQRYSAICRQAFNLGEEGSLSQDSYIIALNGLEEALKKCESVNNSIQTVLEQSTPLNSSLHDVERDEDNDILRVNKEDIISKKMKATSQTDNITIRMYESWQQMGQLSSVTPNCDDGDQHSMHGVGQLSSVTPNCDDGDQHSMHGVGQLHSGPNIIPSCFELQVGQQDMDQPNAEIQ